MWNKNNLQTICAINIAIIGLPWAACEQVDDFVKKGGVVVNIELLLLLNDMHGFFTNYIFQTLQTFILKKIFKTYCRIAIRFAQNYS